MSDNEKELPCGFKKVIHIDFAFIFRFAEENYGICWNRANDIFFGNAFDYKKTYNYYIGDWAGYLDASIKDDFVPKEKASDYTREEVEEMSDNDKSYIITDAFFEHHGITGTNVFIVSD